MKNLLMVICSLALTLAIFELAFRCNPRWSLNYEKATIKKAPPRLLCEDADLPYRYCPGLDGTVEKTEFVMDYRINSWGFRDTEHALAKPQGIVRILGVGDSFMAGVGAHQDASLTAHLGHLLGPKVEVMNMGMQGFGIGEALTTLKQKGLLFQPDVVLLSLSKGDLNNERVSVARLTYRDEHGIVHQRLRWWHGLKIPHPLTFGSFLYQNSALAQGIVHRRLRRWHAEDVAQTVDRMQGYVTEFQHLSQEQGLRFYVVLLPMTWDLESEHWTLFMAEMQNFLVHKGIATVDPRLIVQQARARGLKVHWPMDYHLTAEGYRLIAEVVAQQLRADGVVVEARS